jgi:hypothetical protein
MAKIFTLLIAKEKQNPNKSKDIRRNKW